MSIIQFLVLQVLIFAALGFILYRLMSKHATTATAHLVGLSSDYLKKQDELKKRLEEAEKHYEELIAKASNEAQALKAQALQEAEGLRHQLTQEGRQEAERLVQKAMGSQEALKEELKTAFESKVLEKACHLLGSVLPESIRKEIHVGWCEELLKNSLAQLDDLTIPKGILEARIFTAFPLTENQREVLRKRLNVKCNREILLRESTDPKVVAGLTIHLGDLVMDGSLISKIKQMARHVEDRNGG